MDRYRASLAGGWAGILAVLSLAAGVAAENAAPAEVTERIVVQHRAAAEVLALMRAGNLLPPGLKEVQAVAPENALRATGTPEAVRDLARMLATYLDKPVPRVRLSLRIYVFPAGARVEDPTRTNPGAPGVTRLDAAAAEKALALLDAQEAQHQATRVLDADLCVEAGTPAQIGCSPTREGPLARVDIQVSARVNRDDSTTMALLWTDRQGQVAPGLDGPAPVDTATPGDIAGAGLWRLRQGDLLVWMVRPPTEMRQGALLLVSAMPAPK